MGWYDISQTAQVDIYKEVAVECNPSRESAEGGG
jgi:hypothetical protein